MQKTEILTKLNQLLEARYAKQFVDLNKNVYLSAKTDNGSFEAPMVVLGSGGGIQTDLNDTAPVKGTIAPVSVEMKLLKGIKTQYRIALPYGEMEIASRNEAYFNFLMDEVMSKALGNYVATWGPPAKVRFGTAFVSYGAGFLDFNDDFELKLEGSWAINEESYE